MSPDGILETVLYAEDLDAAEDFYRRVLGLEPDSKLAGRHLFYRIGSGMMLIFVPSATAKPPRPDARMPVPAHGTTGGGHLCFSADAGSIGAWRQHLLSLGVAIEADFEWPEGGRSIYFRDPAGNSLEFAEPRIWGIGEV